MSQVAITGGAAARGVSVGSTRAEARIAFPHARFEHHAEQIFGITIVKVPRRDGGNFEISISAETRLVTGIHIPRIQFCD